MKDLKKITGILIAASLTSSASGYTQERFPQESIIPDDVCALIVISAFFLIYLIFWLQRTKRFNALTTRSPGPNRILSIRAKAPFKRYQKKLVFDHLKGFKDEELAAFREALSSMLQKK